MQKGHYSSCRCVPIATSKTLRVGSTMHVPICGVQGPPHQKGSVIEDGYNGGVVQTSVPCIVPGSPEINMTNTLLLPPYAVLFLHLIPSWTWWNYGVLAVSHHVICSREVERTPVS